jgi:tetratricopeptide (TPR) repeat protein
MEGTHLKNKCAGRLISRFGKAPILAGILFALAWPAQPCLAGQEGVADLVVQAEQAYDNGQWEQALEHYTRLAQQPLDNPEIFFRLGNLHARLGRLREAADSYERVLAGNARHAKSRHNLGVVRVRQAIAALSQAQLDSGATAPPSRRLLDDLEFVLGGRQDAPGCPSPEVRESPLRKDAVASANSPAAYSSARANLRSGPGKSYAKLAILPAGAALSVLARQGDYAQVATPAGQTGWLSLHLLRLGPEPANGKAGDGR